MNLKVWSTAAIKYLDKMATTNCQQAGVPTVLPYIIVYWIHEPHPTNEQDPYDSYDE